MSKKILVVEDSILMRKMLQVMLESYGTHDTESYFAADGREGFRD